MHTILLISDDDTFRNSLRQSLGQEGTAVLGVPNTRDILSQPKVRQVSGYDLIVAEVRSGDHDGLSRLVLFRNLHPNTPFIAVTREDQGAGRPMAALPLGRCMPGSFQSHPTPWPD
ncbi:MAG: response regulator [Nitrospira sp.]|nr:MAG: response regulator [Nitrospira sp.]